MLKSLREKEMCEKCKHSVKDGDEYICSNGWSQQYGKVGLKCRLYEEKENGHD